MKPIDVYTETIVTSSTASTPFTFLPLDTKTEEIKYEHGTQNDKNANEATSTPFTFAPLDTTASLMITEAANGILKTSSITDANVNDATSVYITSDIPEMTLSASASDDANKENKILFEVTTASFDISENSNKTEEDKNFESRTSTEKNYFENFTEIFKETTESTNFRKDRQFSLSDREVTSEMTNSPIMTPKNDEILNTKSTYDKETTNDFESTSVLHSVPTNDNHDIDPHSTLIPGNDRSIMTPVESSTNFVSSESSINLEDGFKATTMNGVTRLDNEYLHDRQTSVEDDTTTAKTKTNNLFNYLLINAIKNDRGNETRSMGHKFEREESAGDLLARILAVLCLEHVLMQ
jgi:hypothetical protein